MLTNGNLTLSNKNARVLCMRLGILLALCLSLGCHKAEATRCNRPPIKIAVLDTGFGYQDKGHEAHLCRYGHKDFTYDQKYVTSYFTTDPVPYDFHSHGTNIAGIIDDYASRANVNYCIVIIKYYSDSQTGEQNMLASTRAFNYAANIKADYINYSGGGPDTNMFERAAVERFLNHGGHLVAAAGNDNAELNLQGHTFYPAMYDKRIIVVGNTCLDGVKCITSNYGDAVSRWEIGENVTAYGIAMTGTSQATAVATGKIVSKSNNKCDTGLQ